MRAPTPLLRRSGDAAAATTAALVDGRWTIGVYMTSTDLAQFAFDDINEMEAAVSGFAPGAAITVFWDQWQSGSFATGAEPARLGNGRPGRDRPGHEHGEHRHQFRDRG